MFKPKPQTPAPGALTRALADVLVGRARTERLTQEQLSAATGIGGTSLQRYLAGKRELRVENLAALAKALHTTIGSVTTEAQNRVDNIPPPAPAKKSVDRKKPA